MKQPPHNPKAPLLDRVLLSRTILLSVVMSVSVLLIFKLMLPKGVAYAQTMAFLSLIVVQWVNSLSLNFEFRSWVYNFVRPNGKLILALGVSIGLNIIIFLTPVGDAFGIVSLSARDTLLAIFIPSTIALVCGDLHKLITHFVQRTRRTHIW